jgi:hypothetical protein
MLPVTPDCNTIVSVLQSSPIHDRALESSDRQGLGCNQAIRIFDEARTFGRNCGGPSAAGDSPEALSSRFLAEYPKLRPVQMDVIVISAANAAGILVEAGLGTLAGQLLMMREGTV